MGIIKKTRNTESLLSAERKVCKRILNAVPELPEEIPAFALRYKGSKRPFFRQFGWYHGVVFVPLSFYDRDGGFFYFNYLP